MNIAVYGPDYKQHMIQYEESEKLEVEAYKLVKSVIELKNINRLPGELSQIYEDVPMPRIFVGRMPWVERKGLVNRVWKNASYSAAGSSIFIHEKLPTYAKSAILIKEIVKQFYRVDDRMSLTISTRLARTLHKIAQEHGVVAVDLEMISEYLEHEMKRENIQY